MAKKKTTDWKERLLEVRQMKAGDLMDHPLNPKVHGDSQKTPLKGLLEEVGKVDILKAYYSERLGGALTLWDGHCRRELDIDQVWNVGIYDLSDAEADLLLATFDPIGWQAQQSNVKLDALLREVSTGSAELQKFLSEAAEKAGVINLPSEPAENRLTENGSGEYEDDFLEEEFKGVYALQEDVIFPSKNAWGIPDLLPEMCSDQIPDTVFARQPIEDESKTLYVFQTAKFELSASKGMLAFYVDDWRFENVWSDAVRMVEGFKSFGWSSIVAPDFSVWRDDPMVIQAWNIYRSRWCARYWQEAGLKVVPSLNWSDERSFDFAHSGIPQNLPVVSVQCRTTRSRKGKEFFGKGLAQAIEKLTPQNVIVYGGAEHRQWIEPLLPTTACYHWLESWTSLRRKSVFNKRGANENES